MGETPQEEKTSSQCPFHKVVEASRFVLERYWEIFGTPHNQKKNLLWGIDGSVFADFIENFAEKRVQNIEIMNPGEMRQLSIIGLPDMGMLNLLIQFPWGNPKGKLVSNLGYALYARFIKENIRKVDGRNPIDIIHFSTFSSTFIQAFDSVFITALRYAKTPEDWESMKKSMWRVILNLARIPTNIQEGLTSSSDRIGYMFGEDEPYLLEHMEEIFRIQETEIGIERAHRDTFEKIEMDGGYGICPALEDGVMKRSFYALHEIYGKVFFSSR